MANDGIASGYADSLNNWVFRNTAGTPPAATHMQLHNANPGAAGTTGAANSSTRQALTCSASSSGTITNSVALTWTNVSDSTTYNHFTVWTASSSGTFVCSGALTANATTAGDTFTIAISGFTGTWTIAA